MEKESAIIRKALVDVKTKKIVYVSCNPSTLAKDCDILIKSYEISWVKPSDVPSGDLWSAVRC
jgi:tRNA/tmRNA/rRNA uracil-C5-methylase (TrmA/RlmC/RlmD family)